MRASRGLTMNPWSAVRSASPNRLLHGSLPMLAGGRRPSIFTAPGTPVARPLTTAVVERQRLAVGVEEHAGGRLRGRDLAAVVDRHLAGPRVVIIHEGAAAEARALRLDQRQHRLDRDRRVDRAAAALQHLEAGLRRERIGGDDERLGAVRDRGGGLAARVPRRTSRGRRTARAATSWSRRMRMALAA